MGLSKNPHGERAVCLRLQKSLQHCPKKRTTYTYENMDFRGFPESQRDSEEWDALYKARTIVERSINHLKTNMCVEGRKSRHHVTTKADVFLAGIASQFTVVVAHQLSYPQSGLFTFNNYQNG